MATTTHTTDMICDGPGEVRHDIDMVIGVGGDDGRWGNFRHGVTAESQVMVRDWEEWTLDSSQDYDGVWASFGPVGNIVGGAGDAKWLVTRSGNEFSTRLLDICQPNPSRTLTSQERHELWSVPVAQQPDTFIEEYDATRPDALFRKKYNHYPQIFVDSNNAVWTMWYQGSKQVGILKLNDTTNCFEVNETRDIQTFNNEPYVITTWRAYQDGDDIHIVWVDHNEGTDTNEYWNIYYSQFDMDTETWTYEDELVRSTAYANGFVGRHCKPDLVVRSGGEVVVWHPGVSRTQGSYTGAAMEYSRRTGVDTWTNATWTNSHTNWYTVYDPITFRCALGDSDRVHFIYAGYDGGTYRSYHRSLSSSNVLDTEVQLDSGTSTAGGNNVLHHLNAYGIGNNIATREDGSDLYIYFFKDWQEGSYYSTNLKIYRFKSEANITVNSHVFAHSDGLGHGTGKTNYFGSAGIPFTSSDGTVNFFRGHAATYYGNPGDKWHTIVDGVGGVVHTQKQLTGNFDTVRQRFGNYQQPAGELVQGTNYSPPITFWEWHWPNVANLDGSGAYNHVANGTHFVRDGEDYFLWSYHQGLQYHPMILVVHPLKDLPKIKVTHTTDMTLNPKPIDHTIDFRIVAQGLTQYIDHTSDMVLVDRITTDHTSDMVLVDVRTKDHTVDMFLSEEVEFTVDVVVGWVVSATRVTEAPPDIQPITIRGVTSYGTSTASGGGVGGSVYKRRKRRVDRG